MLAGTEPTLFLLTFLRATAFFATRRVATAFLSTAFFSTLRVVTGFVFAVFLVFCFVSFRVACLLGFLATFLELAGAALFFAVFGPGFGREPGFDPGFVLRAGLVLARTFFFGASFFFVVFFDGLRFGVSFFCAPVFLMAFFTTFFADFFDASFFGRAFRTGEGFFLATAFFTALERFFLAGLASFLAVDRFFA